MKRITLITALIIMFASVPLVMAQPRGMKGEMRPGGGRHASTLANLNLTTEQSEKIRTMRETHQKDILPIQTKMFTKRAELRLLWMQTKPDSEKIKSKQKEILDLRGQLQEKQTDFRLEFLNTLTPEQRTKLLAQSLGRHHGPRGDMGGPPGRDMGQGGRW
ncbi:MAG: Spy/CpxP family protein refolding chaperone [Desulfobacterales bacterium]|nr:Spy/CpxP family protein refolding chaperone [Desulfobacterales bacterium]